MSEAVLDGLEEDGLRADDLIVFRGLGEGVEVDRHAALAAGGAFGLSSLARAETTSVIDSLLE